MFGNWMKGHDSQLRPLKLSVTRSIASPAKYTKRQQSADDVRFWPQLRGQRLLIIPMSLLSFTAQVS